MHISGRVQEGMSEDLQLKRGRPTLRGKEKWAKPHASVSDGFLIVDSAWPYAPAALDCTLKMNQCNLHSSPHPSFPLLLLLFLAILGMGQSVAILLCL